MGRAAARAAKMSFFLFQRTAPEFWNDKCEVIYPNLDLTHGTKSEAVGVYQAFLSDR